MLQDVTGSPSAAVFLSEKLPKMLVVSSSLPALSAKV